MKWYFALSEDSLDSTGHGRRGLAKIAVTSAIMRTSLQPVLIYDGQENEFTTELRSLGVTIVHHRVSFYDLIVEKDKISPGYRAIASAAFLRSEIPLIERDERYVLFTDVNVHFNSDPAFGSEFPDLFSAASQSDPLDHENGMDAGVMLLHLPALRDEYPEFSSFIRENIHADSPGVIEDMYRTYFRGRWGRLDPKLNWKPYWGLNEQAQIVHWFGPKPPAVRKTLVGGNNLIDAEWRELLDANSGSYHYFLAQWDLAAASTPKLIHGFLDHLDQDTISGWATYEDDPHSTVDLYIGLDGVEVGHVQANLWREDVKLAGKARGDVGFKYNFDAKDYSPGRHEVAIKDRQGRIVVLRPGLDKISLLKSSNLTDRGKFFFHVPEQKSHPVLDRVTEPKTADSNERETKIICFIDEISCRCLRGWAADLSDPTRQVELTISIDDVVVANCLCNLPRSDVAKSNFGIEHVGFEYSIDRRYLDDKPHDLKFQVAADNIVASFNGRQERVLVFRETWQPSTHSHVDGSHQGVIKGWCLRENPEAGTFQGNCQIFVTCDGARSSQLRANFYRPDVGKIWAADPYCGFEFSPPKAFRKARAQTFRFHMAPFGIELEGSPIVASFIDDATQAALSEMDETIDSLYRELTRLRRRIKTVVQKQAYSLGNYDAWARRYLEVLKDNTKTARSADVSATKSEPLVSVICPIFRPDRDYFRAAVASVVAQSYQNWELLLVDDGSDSVDLKEDLSFLALQDQRIKVIALPENTGISRATNFGISQAEGEWIAFFDHDDLLVDVALEIMIRDASRVGAKMIYSDEDKIDPAGNFSDPAFKPDWNYRLLLSANYICHFVMIRSDVVAELGMLNPDLDGAQDHDLLLRLSEKIDPNEVYHVAEVLYHWRISEKSTASHAGAKPYAVQAGISAVKGHLERLGHNPCVSSLSDNTWYKIDWQFSETPAVSILIPFKENVEMTQRCLTAVIQNTEYPNYKVVLIDNWSTTDEAADFVAGSQVLDNVEVLTVEDEFNYSSLNNLGVQQSNADFIVFMNNDLIVSDARWLRCLVDELLADPQVGAVGGKFFYPNGTIQHAGVVVGIGGVASHVHSGLTADDPGYGARALFAQEMTAVTAACMIVRASVFRAVGGFDEQELRVAFNDVDLCLKIRKAGYKVIYNPQFVAVHHESLSRGSDEIVPEKESRFFHEMQTMIERWGDTLVTDPFYSKHFDLEGFPFFDLRDPSTARRT